MEKQGDRSLRVIVSVVAILAAIAHMLVPSFIPDLITAGLLVLSALPWLAPIVKSIEVQGIGKLELQVQEVRAEQHQLREEVDALRFLVAGFVTDWEFVHLEKLASEAPFVYQRGPGRDDRFVQEIIRLRDFGLISKR
ncbi:MAG: hypothetical protein U0794_05615, partial [Isosphaeraceae bacterium]